MKKLASATDPLWYKDAIIYEIHVRAFADSNNDGIGDFPGLMSRLDYLQDLGVTCLWLLPFFPSPLRDDGYDISNYVDVNPSYGTLARLQGVSGCGAPAQHAGDDRAGHQSHQRSASRGSRRRGWRRRASPQRDMYVWTNDDQRFKEARIIFTDTEKSNWTWDEAAKAYYWHRFFSHQPDLNFDNPLVIEEVLKAMRFWLDMGVDGLRLDAIPYLVERDGTNSENLPETHVMIKHIRAAIDEDYANRLILAEANQWPADVRPYFGDGDECHMAFHFPLMPRIYMALRQEDRLPITDIMAQTPPIPDNCQWGLFLRNHDELTLEMVTDDERDYMYFAYSADPRMRINVGIRRRLAPLVDNNRRRIELLNSILFSFPGTPIIYYGDEIGMGDNIYLGDRNGVRTPMQWTSDRNAGFLEVRSGAAVFSGDHGPDLRVPGGERGGAAERPVEPAALDAQHDRAAEAVPGVRARDADVPESIEPEDSGVSARSRSRRRDPRDDSVRCQPEPVCAAGVAGSVAFRGHGAGGDAGLCAVPDHHGSAVFAEHRAVFVYVAGAAAGQRAAGRGAGTDAGSAAGELAGRVRGAGPADQGLGGVRGGPRAGGAGDVRWRRGFRGSGGSARRRARFSRCG